MYFLDDKERLHKACRGKEEWIHTIQEIHAKPEQPLLSWSRVGVSRQAISFGQVTRNIKTGEEVYKTEGHSCAHAMSGSSNLIIVEAVDKGRQINFEVMPPLGSRKLDLLPVRMRLYDVKNVIFTSSQTVAMHIE